MAQVRERGEGVLFLARSKPKIPFLGLSLLRDLTETLATQAKDLSAYGRHRSIPLYARKNTSSTQGTRVVFLVEIPEMTTE